MLKILWVTASSFPRSKANHIKLVESLSSYRDLIVFGKRQKDYYLSLNLYDNVYDLMEGYSNYDINSFDKEITEIIKNNIYKYVEYDRRLKNKNYEIIEKAILHHYSFFIEIFKKNNYSYFVSEIAQFCTKLLQEVALNYNCKIIWPMFSFWENRFTIVTGNEYALKDNVEFNFKNLLKTGISKNENAIALKYIDSVRNISVANPNNLSKFVRDRGVSLKYDYNKVANLLSRIKHLSYYRNSYYESSLSSFFFNKLNLSNLVNKFKLRFYKNIYSSFNIEEKYVLFFLHYEPDLATLVFAPYFKDQIELIKKISFSLPLGYKLYVKEHPLMYKKKIHSYLSSLSKIPQVRLLKDSEQNSKLIDNCSAFISITGSAGWEAIIRKKPVIIFGDSFYNIFPHIFKFKCWEEFNALIIEAINTDVNRLEDYDLFIKYIVIANYKLTFKGNWYNFFRTGVENDNNIKSVIKSFKGFIAKNS